VCVSLAISKINIEAAGHFYIFALALALNTLLSMGLQRINRQRLVS
jgi:surface polysaccharide O-acyltransferase-like enzyme